MGLCGSYVSWPFWGFCGFTVVMWPRRALMLTSAHQTKPPSSWIRGVVIHTSGWWWFPTMKCAGLSLQTDAGLSYSIKFSNRFILKMVALCTRADADPPFPSVQPCRLQKNWISVLLKDQTVSTSPLQKLFTSKQSDVDQTPGPRQPASILRLCLNPEDQNQNRAPSSWWFQYWMTGQTHQLSHESSLSSTATQWLSVQMSWSKMTHLEEPKIEKKLKWSQSPELSSQTWFTNMLYCLSLLC